MPRRRRASKRRPGLSLAEILDQALPPSGLVRRGPDDVDEQLVADDVDFGGGVAYDEPDDRSHHGAK